MKNIFKHNGRKKRAAELVIANKELLFQNKEKEKRTEELINASFARNLIEASIDPLVTISAEGKITDVNKATEQATGVSREQLIGTDFVDYFTEPDKAKEGYKQVFLQGIVKDYPLTLRDSAGRTMDVLYNATIYKNEAGVVQGVFATVRDIRERKLAEIESRKKSEELQLLSNELKIIIDSIPGLVFLKDTNNRFIRVNKYMCDAYNMSKKQLEGTSLNDLHSKEQAQAYWEDDLQVIHSRQSKINIDEPFETKTGNRWVNTSKMPYLNEKGEVTGVIGISIDVTERKQRSEDLSNILTEVKETVNVLNTSSSEILAATSQVASGTAETATAISETSTTVEELQQAVKQTAEKAKNVANSAQRVAQVSQNGQKAVEETVNGMNRIREQMESITQTVIRLSEQSQSIGGIIASVTEIADQSNLLAVNAAIEAAKAGEHGKGFAVVAQEIKNLAGQSKQATSQVRNILNDIQKATGAAVMATEQGSKAVVAGVKQAAQAGEAIRKLAESSNEAEQATIQIVASSQQQVIGMDQIGAAMQNINQAGTETAVSMEKSEKSAKSLNELGQKLKEMVERFTVQKT